MQRKAVPIGPDDRSEDRYQAASLYYVMGETMDTIAKRLKRSRSTVSRLLREARDDGLVRITLGDAVGSESPLAIELGRRFGVVVHPVPVGARATETTRLDAVAKRAGALLAEAVTNGGIIGFAWGRTVARTVQHIAPQPVAGVTVVQLNGSASSRGAGTPYAVATLTALGEAFHAELMLFPLPAFFDHVSTREIMWRERSVGDVLELRRKVDVAIFGVGSLLARTTSDICAAGYLSGADIDLLTADGVVGDVCTVFLRSDGSYADIDYNQRATGPTPAELQQIPRRICVAADASRAAALVAALRAGVVTDLVVDEETARAALAHLDPGGRKKR